jgi:choline dehydrogenase-like flavoprotein
VQADPERFRLQGVDGSGREPGEGHSLCGPPDTPAQGSLRAGGDSRGVRHGIHAHSAEFGNTRISEGISEFEWGTGSLLHRQSERRRRGGNRSESDDQALHQRSASAQWNLHHSLSQFARPTKDESFLRGYGFQGDSGTGFNAKAPGFGEAYKKAATEPTETFTLLGYGEALPRFENYVEIDPHLVDAWGIPVLRFHIAWGDNERNLVKDAGEQAAEMLEAAGLKNVKIHQEIHLPGDANHDVGTARMGSDPKKSVLNQYLQTHDIKNLFVMDGCCFNSPGCQNPTLTIMALAVRSCEYLKEELKKRNI